jgi:hypothetical protein
MIEANQSIEHRILSFKSGIEKPLKGGNDYLIDTAVWYIEALINYTYATVVNNHEGLSYDSVFIHGDLTDGKVTPSEAASVYSQIIDSLTVQYESLPSQNLHLIFADVYSKDSTAGRVTFGIISSFGYGSTISCGSFGQDDYWKYGWGQYNNGGYCDGQYEGTQTHLDAAMKIEEKIRCAMGVSSPRRYPLNIVTLLILAEGDVRDENTGELYYCDFENPNDETSEDNYFDYLMFSNYSNWSNFHYCLSPAEMNFYRAGAYYICTDGIYDCLDELLDGLDFTSIHLIGDNSNTTPYYHYRHYMYNTYGIWVESLNPPSAF